MTTRAPLVVIACLILVSAGQASARASQGTDGIASLLTRLEGVLLAGDPDGYMGLLSATADRERARSFSTGAITPRATRAVVRERDRGPLTGTLPGDGYTLTVEVLVETGRRATLATWGLEVRRTGGAEGTNGDWGISNQEPLTSLSGLHRLAINPSRQFTARNLVIEAEDLKLTLAEGNVFVAEVDGAVTAAVLLGRGDMVFSPSQETERGQLRIFSGEESLRTPFDAVFLRCSPNDGSRLLDREAMFEAKVVDPRELRRADEVFRNEVGKSFGLNLGDLSDEPWSLLPASGDVLAEIRTRRFDTLTYARSGNEVEDITLFDREKRRNISVYSSKAHLERYGRYYSDHDRAEFIVTEYDIEASFNPARRLVEGRTQMMIEITANSLNSLSLRLAQQLRVTSVTATEFGRLMAIKLSNQDAVVVNLPVTVTRGYRFVLAVSYSGILEPQPIDREALTLESQYPRGQEEGTAIPLEPSYLYSNRNYWYPQPSTSGYAKARMRLTVPHGFSCVASGDLVTTVTQPAAPRSQPAHQYHFISMQPARYLSCLITPLVDVRREKIDLDEVVKRYRPDREAGVYYDTVHLNVRAHPRLQRSARQMAGVAADVIRFYASLTGESPYPSITLALIERELPGGHSPPYLVVVSQPGPGSRLSYRDDPASFPEFPEFFLAHELAHQWWGQGVGWKNYHEQWLSEGFAQYFAALYAEKARGRNVFENMMRRMRRFGAEESSQGPIWLGYRVGHVKGDSRVFRSVVYNKSAVVLHMLRRLVGDEAFFRGVRRFLDTWRFRRAGTDDLRAAMEKEVGRPLGRFFERWIHGASLPEVAFSWREEVAGGTRQAVLRYEQTGEIFDLPLQTTISYDDRPPTDVVALLTEKVTELRVPLVGRVRSIDANRDGLALVEIK